MKRILALLLIVAFFPWTTLTTSVRAEEISTKQDDVEFQNLNDPKLLQYVQDNIYAELESELGSDDYIVESVQATYISKEYLDEVEYNSQANIYFGYTLAEVEAQFSGKKFIFTLGDDGTTVVKEFEDYNDTFNRVIHNVAMGSGVILVCVTVSVITAGAGAPAVSMIFAASAKTGTVLALRSGICAGVCAGVATGLQTHDMNAALKSAALSGSEAFKWGAIGGAIAGGVSEAIMLNNTGSDTFYHEIRTWQESEQFALEEYGGKGQLSYLAGEEVPYATPGATRPDVVRMVGDHLEAIDVKNYNLANSNNRYSLYQELHRQVSERVVNLPSGSTQRVVLDVTGRDFSETLIQDVINNIQRICGDVYPNLPVDII